MAFIPQIDEEHVAGPLKEIYDAAKQRAGRVANIIKTMSLDPPSCQASMGLYVALMKSRNGLDSATKEMLAAVVSNVNDCFY